MANIGAPQNFIPPRLLGGAALVFWGAMIGQPIVGLCAALILEASYWLPVEFKLKNSTYLHAWQLGAMLFLLTLLAQWVLGKKLSEIYGVIVWAPLYFLPVELAQRYGTAKFIPANTFSFFARRKMMSDIKEGRPVDPLMVNTGYPFIIMCVLTAAQTGRQGILLFITTLSFTIICLFFITRNQKRWLPITALFVCIGMGGWSTQLGILKIKEWVIQQRTGRLPTPTTNSEYATTQIGNLGKIKLSNNIYWRATYQADSRPRLLREATYNKYDRRNWRHVAALDQDGSFVKPNEDYQSAGGPGLDTMQIFNYQSGEGKLDVSDAQRVTIRGKVKTETVLPVPDGTMSMSGIARTLEQLYRMEADDSAANLSSNSLGTVKLENPEANVVEYTAYFGNSNRLEKPPYRTRVFPHERRSKKKKNKEIDKSIQKAIEGTLLDKVIPESTVSEVTDFFQKTPQNTKAKPISEHVEHEFLDLKVPPKERQALRQVIQEAQLKGLPLQLAILQLRRFFSKEFTYSTHLKIKNGKESALTDFLTKTREGHCEYFATATTLIMRELGFPSRYAVGFAVDEKGSTKDSYIMRGNHAHAWSRVYTGRPDEKGEWGKGKWIDADLTPAGWIAIDTASIGKQSALSDWFQKKREDAILWRTSPENQTRVYQIFSSLIAVIAAWIAIRLYRARKAGQRRQINRGSTPLALATLEKTISKILPPRTESEPLSVWASTLLGRDPEIDQMLPNAIRLHQKTRFDPEGLTSAEQHELKGVLHSLEDALKSKRKDLQESEQTKSPTSSKALP